MLIVLLAQNGVERIDEYNLLEVAKNNGYYGDEFQIEELGKFFQNAVSEANIQKYAEDQANLGARSVFVDLSLLFADYAQYSKKFNPIMAIMYAILVIQSLMYFVSYMKRLFYVIVLAMFAPVIIIFDFAMGK